MAKTRDGRCSNSTTFRTPSPPPGYADTSASLRCREMSACYAIDRVGAHLTAAKERLRRGDDSSANAAATHGNRRPSCLHTMVSRARPSIHPGQSDQAAAANTSRGKELSFNIRFSKRRTDIHCRRNRWLHLLSCFSKDADLHVKKAKPANLASTGPAHFSSVIMSSKLDG